MFIFQNIYCYKLTIYRSPHYSLKHVQIFNGSSRNLTPSNTMRDAWAAYVLTSLDWLNLNPLTPRSD